MARDTEFCKHYQAMSDHETCKKGIAYSDFKGLKFDQRPCFERDGVAHSGCPLAEFPTPEERAERDRETMRRIVKIGAARGAIVDHCGGPWRGGQPSQSGVIDCPVCGGTATLRFSRSGYNGHIHAGCTTDGCVRWVE